MPVAGRPEPLWGGLFSTFARNAAAWLASHGKTASAIFDYLQRQYIDGPRRDTEALSTRAIQQLAEQATRVKGLIDDWRNGLLGPRIARVNIPRAPLPAGVAYRVVAILAMTDTNGATVWRPVQLDFSRNPTSAEVNRAAVNTAPRFYGSAGGSPNPFSDPDTFTVTDVDVVSIQRRT